MPLQPLRLARVDLDQEALAQLGAVCGGAEGVRIDENVVQDAALRAEEACVEPLLTRCLRGRTRARGVDARADDALQEAGGVDAGEGDQAAGGQGG